MARSTIILGVIAAAMLAFILLHERDTLSSGELDQRKNRVLTTFVRDRVTRVELVRGGNTAQKIVLERAPDPEQEDVLGAWKMLAPLKVAVDQEAMEVLIGELEWLQPRRVIEDIDAEDQKRFGFTQPRIEVRYTIGKQRGSLLVGANEPAGPGLYVRGDDPDVAFIVGKDLFEGLDHDAGHFHTKELHQGVFVFAASAIVSKNADGELRGELKDGVWSLAGAEHTLLSTVDVEGAIKAFDQLRAKRYVAATIAGPLSYGLDHPTITLTVERKRSTDPEASSPVVLRVGDACGEHAGEKYIQVDKGPIMCAADEELAKVARPLNELVDRSPFPVDPERVIEMQLQDASNTITLSKKEERWVYTVAAAGKPASKQQPADRDAVTQWMTSLRAARAINTDAVAGETSGSPLVTMSLKTSTQGPALRIAATTTSTGEASVLRGAEVTPLRFDAATAELLRPVASRFRSLQLIDEADAPLTRISVELNGSAQTAERAGESWFLKAPVQAPADTVALADVAHLLTRLSAVRFIDDMARAHHGLGRDATKVSFQLGATSHVLELGAAASDGVYARLDGDASVFVVPTRVPETINADMLAKSVLATALEDIASAEITAPGATAVTVKKEGGRFVAANASTSATAIVERIARLRVQDVVHYGPTTSAEGLDKPRLSVVVTTTAGATHTLTFGLATGDAQAPQVFARRSDVAATVTVNAVDFDRLAEITQPR